MMSKNEKDPNEEGPQMPHVLSSWMPAIIVEAVVGVDEAGAVIAVAGKGDADGKDPELESDEDLVLPENAHLERRPARLWKAATILAGAFGAVINTLVVRMCLADHGVSVESLDVGPWVTWVNALIVAPALVFLALEPWKTAFAPQGEAAERRERRQLAACVAGYAALQFCATYFPLGSSLRKLFGTLLAVYQLVVVCFAATAVRFRHAYGGLWRLLDHGTGVLVALLWLACLGYRLTGHDVFLLIVFGIQIFVLPPWMVGVYPTFHWARRHYFDRDRGGDAQPEAEERDAAMLVLLVISSLGLPYAIGFFSAGLYSSAPVGSVQSFLVVFFVQGVLALFTKELRAVAEGAVALRKSIPFVFFVVLTADAFMSLVFMTTNFRTESFWMMLSVNFFIMVMRDADLWRNVQKRIAALSLGCCRCRFCCCCCCWRRAADAMIGAMHMPEELASTCEMSEVTATLAVLSVAVTEIACEALGVGVSGMTIGMSQQERWDIVSGQCILFVVQIGAMRVSRTILKMKRNKETGKTESRKNAEVDYVVLQMWHEHGFYIATSALYVMMQLVFSSTIVKIDMRIKG
mmetsp:Transcript_143451/g.458630  ORF Transcript_143451/g.458630 Transcript_143451/m.458630 type:complete len:577 (+) Transcript_143451:181-1911(+)